VLELIARGALRPEDVTTTVGPLDDAPRTLREHFLEGGVKAVLTA
jgi:threonine dehydrogenase-like Zn-dependent dehydrogenase